MMPLSKVMRGKPRKKRKMGPKFSGFPGGAKKATIAGPGFSGFGGGKGAKKPKGKRGFRGL